MSTGLSFEEVSCRFGEQTALEGLALECQPGTMSCLVGPNGAGKSTALALGAGLLAPTSGRVSVDGHEVDPRTPPASTGYLPQRSAFHPSFLVAEVIDFTVVGRSASADDLDNALEVTGLAGVMQRPVGQLSGGWIRRLGLLSALLGWPRLLLLDEPFAGLDPETHDRLLAHLGRRLESNATVIVASHDFEAVDPFGPQVVVLDEGRLRAHEVLPVDGSGSSRAVYRRLGRERAVVEGGLG